MKKLVLLVLLFTGIVNAQIISIPDPNLKAALLNPISIDTVSGMFISSVDTNSDGEIELSEALDIRQIILDGFSISDMTGIEAFSNLEGLSITNNQITSLNLTMLPLLQYVSCNNNPQLTSINLSGLTQMNYLDTSNIPQLATLDLSGSAITSILITQDSFQYLDASNCTNLTTISVTSAGLYYINFDGCTSMDNISLQSTQLTSIAVHDLPSLTRLHIYLNTQLAMVTFANCPLLNNLYLAGNIVSAVDVSGLPALQQLWLDSTQVSTLDVSNNHQLTFLVCSNNLLQSVDIKNGSAETFFSFGGNPNLAFVCADDSEVAFVQSELLGDGIIGAAVSSYCTFTPGGDYNTITGIARFDSNNNGCDAADLTPNNIRINISDGSSSGASFLNNSGNFNFYTLAGNFTIAPSVENPTFFNFLPASASIPFANNNNNTATQNFCITANGVHHDVEVVISPVTPARPGFDAIYKLIYKNKGNQTENLYLNFYYDDDRLNFLSSSVAPYGSFTGIREFNIPNIRPFGNGSITITMHVNAPTDTPAVNVGDVLPFTAMVEINGDEYLADNEFVYDQTVVGSFDPNDITCLEGDVVAPSEIGNYLHYAINFENTGTDVAENIVVKMEIDPAQFNLNSLQLLNASHIVAAKITGNIVEFVFENIDLNIGGHGHILLKLKSNSALSVGSTVSRRADIFFDYNLPVDTGAANTTFQILKTQDFQTDSSVVLSPNPTNGVLTVKSKNPIRSVSIFDAQGRVLRTHSGGNSESTVDLSHYPKGIYFVKVTTGAGTQTEKIVRE